MNEEWFYFFFFGLILKIQERVENNNKVWVSLEGISWSLFERAVRDVRETEVIGDFVWFFFGENLQVREFKVEVGVGY